MGEAGLDFYRDRADPDDQRRAFSAQLAIARRANKPVVIHLRDQDGAEDAVAEAFRTLTEESDGTDVILHCFSMGPSWAERAAEAGLVLLVRRESDLPEVRAIREAAAGSSPRTACWSRPTRRFFRRSPSGSRASLPNVVATAERLAEVRGVAYGELERTVGERRQSSGGEEPTPGAVVAPPGPGLPRGPEPAGDDRPQADLAATDVVLEVGGGRGSQRAPPRRRSPSCIWSSSTSGSVPARAARSTRRENVKLVWGDAMRIDLADLTPATPRRWSPTCPTRSQPHCSFARSPSFLDRRLGGDGAARDRRPAAVGAGHAAVRIRQRSDQYACEVTMLRTVDPAVFVPRPRVGSALRLRRTGPAPSESLASIVRLAFAPPAQVAGALAGDGPCGQPAAGRRALERIGRPPDARAEVLSPTEFERLAAALEEEGEPS